MGRTYCWLAVGGLSLLSLWTGPAAAESVLDQSFLGSSQLSGGAGAGHYGAPTLTQTFTVGVSGTLSGVALPLYRLNLPSVVTVALYTVSGGVPTSVRLGSASLNAASLPGQINHLPVRESELTRWEYGSQNIPVTAGEQLAFTLSATEPLFGAPGVGVYGGTGYPGGSLSYDIGNGPVSEFPYSLFFQTYVEKTALVPEPASAALLGVALISFVWWRRKSG